MVVSSVMQLVGKQRKKNHKVYAAAAAAAVLPLFSWSTSALLHQQQSLQ
jgi:hypothetical protein